MTLLFRYLLRDYLKMIFTSLGVISIAYLAIDFFQRMGKFAEAGAGIAPVVEYFILKIPVILLEVFPFALLVSTILTLGSLTRHNEITAIRSCGISVVRFCVPIALVGLGFSTILFLANMSIVPASRRQAKYVKEIVIEKKPRLSDFAQNRIWFRADRYTFFNLQLIEADLKRMYGVRVLRLTQDFSLPEEIEAKEMRYEAGGWMLLSGVKRQFLPDGTLKNEPFNHLSLSLAKTPDDFKPIEVRADEMQLGELRRYVERLEQDGLDATRYRVDLQKQISFPFMNLVMVLTAIPFGLREPRQGGLARGLGFALLLSVAYNMIFSLSITLGQSGVFPPALSAWFAHIVFLAVGAYLLLKIRQ